MVPRVLYLLNNSEFFFLHRNALAQGVRAKGYDLTIALPDGPGVEAVEAAGFRCLRIRLSRRSLNPFGGVRTFVDILRACREVKPDLVHCFTIKPIIFGSFAARLCGIPVVNSVTGLGYVFTETGAKASILRAFVVRLYRAAFNGPRTQVIFQNPDDRELFVKQGMVMPDRTRVILGAGVDMSRYSPSAERIEPPTILLPARMLWHKGIGELIEAAKIMKDHRKKFEIILAGGLDPDNPAAIPRVRIEEWERDGLARWIGHRSDMAAIFSMAQIVCLPSYREGVPMALLEAASMEKPIVTTDVPGCREIVESEVTGLLIEPKSPAALAAALERLLDDSELRARLGKAARERVAKYFSKECVVRESIEVYRESIS